MMSKSERSRAKWVMAVVLALLLALAATAVFADPPTVTDYQTDSDGDNIPDFLDTCPGEADLYGYGILNNGCAENDTDGDNMPDRFDLCPNAPLAPNQKNDNDGCPVTYGTMPLDSDGDNVPNVIDDCDWGTPFPLGVKNNGCIVTNGDLDAMPNDLDACASQSVLHAGEAWADTFPFTFGLNNNGCGFTNSDGDALPNVLDECPFEFGTLPNGCVDPAAVTLRGAGAGSAVAAAPFVLLLGMLGVGSTAVLRRRRG